MTPTVLAMSRPSAGLELIELARNAVHRLGATALVVLPEGTFDWDELRSLCDGIRTLVVAATARQADAIRQAGLVPIEVERGDLPIVERISLALLEAVANDHLSAGDQVVVVYSGFEADALDSCTVVRLGEHLERLSPRDLKALETSVPLETLRAVVDLAVEIGREGREGKAVGTLIVVGDFRRVLSRSRTLGFDPFRGYTRRERNLRDNRVREAIKEIAQMDGAFVVSRDGTVEAACRIIDAPTTGLSLPKGLGTRHWAAAAITNVTQSLAIVVSQSNGTVRIFQDGDIKLRIAPMQHDRAMKWHDSE